MLSIFKELEIDHEIFSLLELLMNPIDQIILKLKINVIKTIYLILFHI